LEAEPEAGEWLALARLVRPRGRKGEMIADVLTDFPERFAHLRSAFVGAAGARPEPVEIADAWWHQGKLILRFAGVDSIGGAEGLRGKLVMIPRSQRMVLGEGRFYLWELLGCELVCEPGGRTLGTVTAVEPTGGVDLLRVEPPGVRGREVLVPFACAICREIDVAARRIVIEPPEGLLELNEAGSSEA